jgi:O-acetylserine/cysteine efflux transporter
MKPRHIVLLVLVSAVWGLNFVVVRLGLNQFPPLVFTCLRFVVCALPVVVIARPAVPWPQLLSLGFVLGAAVFGFLFAGMAAGLRPGTASLVMQTQVLFTLVLGALVLREKPGRLRWIGVLLGMAGIASLARDSIADGTATGFALVLAGALSWGIANLQFRRLQSVSMLAVMVWISLVPPIPLWGLSDLIEGPGALPAALQGMTLGGAGALLYTSVLSTLFGYGVWGAMIRDYGASPVAPFALLVPIFAMAGSHLVFGERWTPAMITGSALVLAGLAVNVAAGRRTSRARAAPDPIMPNSEGGASS